MQASLSSLAVGQVDVADIMARCVSYCKAAKYITTWLDYWTYNLTDPTRMLHHISARLRIPVFREIRPPACVVWFLIHNVVGSGTAFEATINGKAHGFLPSTGVESCLVSDSARSGQSLVVIHG